MRDMIAYTCIFRHTYLLRRSRNLKDQISRMQMLQLCRTRQRSLALGWQRAENEYVNSCGAQIPNSKNWCRYQSW